MTVHSKNKGGRGEREAIAVLAEYGIIARRTASMQSGRIATGVKVPDLLCETQPMAWIEVKRGEALRAVRDGIRQAVEGCDADPADRIPVVLYRGNRMPWIIARPLLVPAHGVQDRTRADVGAAIDLIVREGALDAFVVRHGTAPLWLAPMTRIREWLRLDCAAPPL